ncbi:MAG: recombination protein RecR [Candidatus Yanofskybacteria bacterium RIFCSPHIGHO2_01_FULL_39_8b]|uniref:Recombination protein RecR n=1 Tax=Candidatus Yanofskybacteria bacterium RIFCSPHIGHO2_01_FULL_39_8b TaxID=1802659 RepID=A0A1F8EB17_9BACT|nr:MAG: recombination protein RecR [Candidatus Yanofskybacteria bacterium RIFCSPHIGHO2_01_FULL_39_8b]
MNQKFRQTIKLLQKLPGVGPRQATRFVLALLEKDESELRELGQAIVHLKKEIRFCEECFNISERASPTESGRENGLCHICSDPKRDQSKLLVLEKVTDLDSIEKTGLYKGLYHVLGGSINPLDGITPETLKFRALEGRIDKLSDKNKLELIIATNPNTTGETTALYIKDLLKDKTGIILTRLGRGLASGSNLEYADEITLRNALEYRK